VESQQVTSDTFRIQVRGNAYTDTGTVQDYRMLRAAEITKEHGGTHFMIISAEDASRTTAMGSPGVAVFGQHMAVYSPGSVSTMVHPGEDAYIRIMSIKTGQTPPSGAVSADEIIKYIGSRVKRS
jgi:hypothetical protein